MREAMIACGDKSCDKKVHYVSPAMWGYFSHAVITMPNGTEEEVQIPQPRKYHTTGDSRWSDEVPLDYKLSNILVEEYKEHTLEDLQSGAKGRGTMTTRRVQPELVLNSTYNGIDKDDEYYKAIDKIEARVEELYK